MLLISIAFSALLSGYDIYINACSAQGDSRQICKCQADFLALKLADDEILQLSVAGSAAAQGNMERIEKIARENPKVITAVEKLEKEAAACGQEF